jgi:hypothetical protein
LWGIEQWFGFNFPQPLPNYVFRVTSKNCDPVVSSSFFDYAPTNPYNTSGIDATMRTGSGTLSSQFQSNIASDGSSSTDTEPILQAVNSYSLLPCSNPVVPSPEFLDPSEPFYQEAGTLISPFFFKDTTDPLNNNELTFYVQPSLTETTVVDWVGWAVPYPSPTENWQDPTVLNQIPIASQVPIAGPARVNPGDPVYSVYPTQKAVDWLTSYPTGVMYGTTLVGKNGGINLRASSPPGQVALLPSSLGSAPVTGTSPSPASRGPSASGAIMVVGKAGLSLGKLQSMQSAQRRLPMLMSAAKPRTAKS